MTTILEAPTAQDSDTPATPVFAAPIRHPNAWTVADRDIALDVMRVLARAVVRG
jgi:hypothetical protein